MNTHRLVIALFIASTCMLLSFAYGDQAGNAAHSVKQLQQSRIAVYEELVRTSSFELKQGGVTEQDVFEAEVMLLDARAHATSDEKERLDLLKQKVKVLSRLETFQKVSVEHGRCSGRTLLLTRARNIEAHIAVAEWQ